jgi:hypothetical protein
MRFLRQCEEALSSAAVDRKKVLSGYPELPEGFRDYELIRLELLCAIFQEVRRSGTGREENPVVSRNPQPLSKLS